VAVTGCFLPADFSFQPFSLSAFCFGEELRVLGLMLAAGELD
jgi:hypothetical protein